MNLKTFAKDHPFRVLGKFFMRNPPTEYDVGEENFLLTHVMSVGAKYNTMLTQSHTNSLDALISHTPGFWHLRVRDPTPNAALLYHEMEIVQISFIHPRALSLFREAQSVQLDASFDSLKPFIYSVALALVFNNALPLGLQLSPTERMEHYATFYTHLLYLLLQEYADEAEPLLQSKPVLSDEGSGLKSFCLTYQLEQFNCYRHLIESFGSSTFVAIIVQRLLFTSSIGEYHEELPQALSDLKEIHGRGKITEQQNRKLCTLFLFQFSNDQFVPIDPDRPDFPQALWNRTNSGVSTFSNHVERIHRSCNKVTRNFSNLVRRIEQVLSVLQTKWRKVREAPHKQSKFTFQSLKKQAAKLQLRAVPECPNATCNWAEIYSRRFGVDEFPCLHNCLTKTIEEMTFPILSDFHSSTDESIVHVEEGVADWAFRGENLQIEPASAVLLTEIDEISNRDEALPLLKESDRFIYRLARELMAIRHLDESLYIGLLLDVKRDWTIFVERNQIDEGNLSARSFFRLNLWSQEQ
jgi:hypothetical protein